MILKIIEYMIIFIVIWMSTVNYIRYNMNKELKIKGDVTFSNINIIKVQKTLFNKNIIHANVNGERIKIIRVSNTALNSIKYINNITVCTRMCVYGFVLLHNGFLFNYFKQ